MLAQYNSIQIHTIPFNQSTTIKYTICAAAGTAHELSSLQLKIYDLLGHEIITLDNKKQKPGYYEVYWNAIN